MQCKNVVKSILTVSLINSCLIGLSGPVIAKPEVVVQNTTQTTNQLSEQEIRRILEAINKAQDKKNVEGVTKFLAPFASAEIIRRTSDISVTSQLVGKEALTSFLQLTMDNIQERKIIDQQVSVNVLENGQLGIANIRTVRETTTKDGKRYYSASLDTIHFGIVDKQPMIIFAKIEGWLAERPAQK